MTACNEENGGWGLFAEPVLKHGARPPTADDARKRAYMRRRIERSRQATARPMPNREDVFQELHWLAMANGGRPLGVDKFEPETGMTCRDWQVAVKGARWNDVLREGGCPTKTFGANRISAETLLEKYAQVALRLQRLPTVDELRITDARAAEFPDASTFPGRSMRSMSSQCPPQWRLSGTGRSGSLPKGITVPGATSTGAMWRHLRSAS